MPVVQSLMDKLVERYGKGTGERVYYSMEATGKGPFAPGGKYRQLHEDWATKHGLAPMAAKGKKKGVRSRSKARPRRK